MNFDAKTIENLLTTIVELPAKILFATAVLAVFYFYCVENRIFGFDLLPQWLMPVAALLGVFVGILLLMQIGTWGRRQYRIQKGKKARRKQIEAYLNSLSPLETEILSYLVQYNQRSFTTEITNDRVATLVHKKLLVRANGTHNVLAWPHIVPDDVWIELLMRSQQFNLTTNTEHEPWVDQWTRRI